MSHRRYLHQHPEVGLALPDTHEYIAGVLLDLGLEIEIHPSAGISTRIPGLASDGVVSILRADMDALPVQERTDLDYGSVRPGAMHACGHDLHMAMLLGAAKVLTEAPPRHDTVLVFQPGEEADRGAVEVLKHKNLSFPGPATAFAVHVHATLDPGAIWCRSGVFMAFGDWFTVHLAGPGGHASQPHLAGNPLEAAGDFTLRLRELVSEIGAGEGIVATPTEALIGNTVNVIPATGRLRGTIRTLSAQCRSALIAGMEELLAEVVSRHGITGRLMIQEGYPAVINDGAFMGRLENSLCGTALGERVVAMPAPSMVIEDFAYFLQRWPGAMVYLGARGDGNTSFNHADDVVFDEDALSIGTALHLLVADGI